MSAKPSREQQETAAALLGAAGRRKSEVPLRRDLVQQGGQRSPQPGPLCAMVRHHDERALDLYLLLRAMASAAPWDVTRDARIWGRALGLASHHDGGASAVSKTWQRLDGTYGLVRSERRGRLAKITVLNEAGNRGDYTYPTEAYFKVPFAYWLADERWYTTLSFPAKAVLLIALTLRPPFILPAERAPAWYGMSADTAQRGLHELRTAGLLARRLQRVENWLSPTGETVQARYTLQPPFGQARRQRRRSLLHVVGE